MRWPQVLIIALFSADVGLAMGLHGMPKGFYNFFTTLIADAIILGILYAGGFFHGNR